MKISKGWVGLFIASFLIFFSGAFFLEFFADDFTLLGRVRGATPVQLAEFFSLYSMPQYRPLQFVFFWVLSWLPFPQILGRLILFASFLGGIYFLYKTGEYLMKDWIWGAFLATLYAFHSSHVYRLYWFYAAIPEVFLFLGLAGAVYYALHNKWHTALLFFIVALISREEAVFFPLVLFPLYYWRHRSWPRTTFLYSYAVIALFFGGVHMILALQSGLLESISVGSIVQNAFHYGLYSLGIPANGLQNVLERFVNPVYRWYMMLLFGYLFMIVAFSLALLLMCPKRRRQYCKVGAVSAGYALLFIVPVVLLPLRWAAWNTLSLIFVCAVQATLFMIMIRQKKMYLQVGLLVGMYLVINLLGVGVHEGISTYRYQSEVVQRAKRLLTNAVYRFDRCEVLYFKNPPDAAIDTDSWKGAAQLAQTFSGGSYVHYLFPRSHIQVVYEGQIKSPPRLGACAVDSGTITGHYR